MKRRWFAVFGGTVLVAEAGVFVSARGSTLGPVVGTLVGLGAVLFVLGGFDPVPERVPWFRFLGAGVLALGSSFVVGWVPPALAPGATRTDLALAVAGTGNGLVLGFVGLDWFRGSRHFGISTLEAGPLLGDRGGGRERDRDDRPGG